MAFSTLACWLHWSTVICLIDLLSHSLVLLDTMAISSLTSQWRQKLGQLFWTQPRVRTSHILLPVRDGHRQRTLVRAQLNEQGESSAHDYGADVTADDECANIVVSVPLQEMLLHLRWFSGYLQWSSQASFCVVAWTFDKARLTLWQIRCRFCYRISEHTKRNTAQEMLRRKEACVCLYFELKRIMPATACNQCCYWKLDDEIDEKLGSRPSPWECTALRWCACSVETLCCESCTQAKMGFQRTRTALASLGKHLPTFSDVPESPDQQHKYHLVTGHCSQCWFGCLCNWSGNWGVHRT